VFSDVACVVYTGNPGSGKSYEAVRNIYDNLLAYYGSEMKILTNLPVSKPDIRVERREWTEDELANPNWEEYKNRVLVIDEAQRYITSKNAAVWMGFIGECRHHNIRVQLLTQSFENLPEKFKDLAEIWYECTNGRSERDATIGLLMYDWSCIG
jgi:zona occludens toxin (predicted ATPase)